MANELIVNRGQAEKEFKVEVEVIGKVRHKNLVGLIGYCAEGAQRYLTVPLFNVDMACLLEFSLQFLFLSTGSLSMSTSRMAIWISGYMVMSGQLAL